jgi:transcription elongation factor SPT6
MLTEDDDLIRAQDIPERMQLVTSSLSTTATLSLDPPLVQDDLQEAAHWVSLRLSTRIQNEFFTPTGKMHQYLTQLVTAVRSTLDHLFLNNLEVPYIMTHKQDDIWHIDPPRRIELLNTSELWRVYTLGQKFRALVERKKVLDSNYKRLNITDNYYEHEIKLRLESIENVTDTTEWLATKYQTEQQDAAAIEDGIYGARKMKKPTRVSEYDVLKKTSISKLAAVSVLLARAFNPH